jgi:hypothetical protein
MEGGRCAKDGPDVDKKELETGSNSKWLKMKL